MTTVRFLTVLAAEDLGLTAGCRLTTLVVTAACFEPATRFAEERLAAGTGTGTGRADLARVAGRALTKGFLAIDAGLLFERTAVAAGFLFEKSGTATAGRAGGFAAFALTRLGGLAVTGLRPGLLFLPDLETSFPAAAFPAGKREALPFVGAGFLSTTISGTTRFAGREAFGLSYDFGLIVKSYTF